MQPSNSPVDFKHQFTTPKGDSYELVPLTNDNLQDTIAVEVKAFMTRDPTVITSGCSEASFRKFTEIIAQRALEDGLGIVCKESKTGKVVGASLVDDYFRSTVDPWDFSMITDDGLGDTLDLVSNIKLSDKFSATAPNQVVDLFLLCVDPDYTNQKIGSEMVRYITDGHPITSKANEVYANCTSPLTYKITTGMKWNKLDMVDPRGWKNKKGEETFGKVDETAQRLGLTYEGIILVSKKLK